MQAFKNSQKKQSIETSAFFMSVGTFVSRVLGMVRDMVIGALFSRTETDAFFVAFRIPNFFRRFIGEGALSISFIPVFTQCLANSTQQKAKNMMNSVYTLLLLVVASLTGLGILEMDSLFQFLFADSPFAQVEGKLTMTVTMARILFLYLFLVTLYAYFMGIANALGSFFVPALAPAFLNIFIILCAFLPKGLVPYPSLLLCYGVLAGGLAQVVLTAGLLYRLGFLPRLSWVKVTKDLKMFFSRFLPGLLGVGGFALIGLLNLYFSGQLPEGTHTYIYYGDRLLELPRSLIAISMGTALLPNLAFLSAQGKKSEMLKAGANQRDLLLFLILPCAVAFYFMGLPIIEVLFQRGRFSALTAENTALVLKIYSFLLVTSSLCRVLATCFYAVKNTWYPALCSGFYVVFHWLLTPYIIEAFALPGLIWATVASNFFFMCLLAGAYPFFVGRLYLLSTALKILHFSPGLIVLGLYLSVAFRFSKQGLLLFMGDILAGVMALVFVLISSIALYLLVGFYLRVPQAKQLLNLLNKK